MNLEQIRAKAELECDYPKDKNCIKVRVGASADHPASADVLNRFQQDIDRCGIKAKVIAAGSSGLYDFEPVVLIEKPGRPAILYRNITPETASELVNGYLSGDNPGPDLALYSIGGEKIDGIPDSGDMPVFNLQNRIALRNCGYIEPESINEYILCGQGYSGLSSVLQMSRTDVIGELKKSGLRGRGGGGYSTAEKWKICHDTEAGEKYIICDGMDADPRARTARLLIESDPHSVLEGMLIGACVIGACRGFICVNSEYKTAIKRLRKALEQMRNYGLLGDNILDSDFKCDIEIKEIESSLVSGEETALIRFLENKQAMPYLRTTYPAVSGFEGKPTLVNNIETLSHVSAIFQNSAAWYSGIGTERSRGTKIITLSGNVVHQYTVEVPFGTTLRTVVVDIGGGVLNGKGIKAVQFGGPTGCYFTGDSLDITIDYETMNEAGGIMGSGTIEVYGSDSCAVEMARDVMSYLQAESCGKCVFGREGTYQMSDILNDIAENKGKHEDLDLLVELGEGMKNGSICGLGRTAPDPVLSSIKLFRRDYDAHITEKRCSANASH
ncbi:MAG: NADH-quinone oxidoreductase subunit L [Dehalococcoidales bacterium]|nr:NADH-quinone oxidoreductase subunit L [Dehalococcoidales bacterium]